MGGGRWNGLPQSSNAFWPLKSNYAQKGVGKLGADQEGQPTRSAWGGRGRQQLSLGKGGWDRGWGWGKGLPPESANGMGTRPRSPAGAGPQVGRPQRPFEPHPPHALGKGMPPLPAQMARGAFASVSFASQTGKMGGGQWNGLPQSSAGTWTTVQSHWGGGEGVGESNQG